MRVQFQSIAAGGDAVGRDETGRVVFAPYAAPGDVAGVAVDEEHRAYARGHIERLEIVSAQRVTPPCPFYLPARDNDPATACGGCQVQHLQYEAQLAAKRDIVRDALQRIGGIRDDVVQPCIPSPLPFAYRNKADLVVTIADGQPQIGFFARGSHHVIDVTHCPIQQTPNNELLAAARDCIAAGLAPPFDPATGRGVLRRLIARTASDGSTLLIAVTSRAAWPESQAFAESMKAAVPSLVGVLWRPPRQEARVIAGRDWLEETVSGLRLRVTGEDFFQVNAALTPTLVDTALRMAHVQGGERALDLFCGVGLFALALARAGARVLGLESNRVAVHDARFNAQRNGLAALAAFRASDAVTELKRLSADEWEVILLDPPRAGAADCLAELVRLRPRRIVYVSCDPATFARDVKILTAQHYHLAQAVPLDLFPQTAHIETVARLERL